MSRGHTVVVDAPVLAALAEPNRLRIVELLAEAPRAVGEIAAALDLRQPQVTKHLQTLERANIVAIYPLGRRRVCALRRDTLDQIARWADKLAVPGPDDAALMRYRAAIASRDPAPVTVRRIIPISRAKVWRAFTDPKIARLWWHPRHFTVAAFRLEPHRGGAVAVSLREGDGTEHRARGQVLTIDKPHRLSFTLNPLDADDQALFTARHDLEINTGREGAQITLTVTPSDVLPNAEPAIAGLAIGWEQLLDNLAALANDP
jgi:uncharacterized protein YndB with AHSA1/START domain/DNA-binding transcriptional ArsR family regulator